MKNDERKVGQTLWENTGGCLQAVAEDTCWQIRDHFLLKQLLMMVGWLEGKAGGEQDRPTAGSDGRERPLEGIHNLAQRKKFGLLDVASLGACFESIWKGKKNGVKKVFM